MFAQIYKHLKKNGFDVYSIGQHEGICTNPYIVVKENGESEVIGTSLINDTVELLRYIGDIQDREDITVNLNVARNTGGIKYNNLISYGYGYSAYVIETVTQNN